MAALRVRRFFLVFHPWNLVQFLVWHLATGFCEMGNELKVHHADSFLGFWGDCCTVTSLSSLYGGWSDYLW
jgi:hypothetical protein